MAEHFQDGSSHLLGHLFDLHQDNLQPDGFSHFETAHHFCKVNEKGKLGCQLKRVCQITKAIITRCQINADNLQLNLRNTSDNQIRR
ncbi:hypothetical protein GDO81_010705 [Engystomops pustulosus]|uniref:Interleukin-7 n=1 Tax=Engystomops pustulosus TaxID=76066 RepID=A0AAV7C281_ENGPU|nr:hypothetical protein GDO81_010705 [Engystomops pustulosus]